MRNFGDTLRKLRKLRTHYHTLTHLLPNGILEVVPCAAERWLDTPRENTASSGQKRLPGQWLTYGSLGF